MQATNLPIMDNGTDASCDCYVKVAAPEPFHFFSAASPAVPVCIHANMDFIVGILGRRYKATSRNIEFSFQQVSRLVDVVLQGICFQYKETVLPLGKDGFRTQTRRLFKNPGAYWSANESVKVQNTSIHSNSTA